MGTVLRSLLARSLLFSLGSGLHLERSKPNSALTSSAQEVSTDSDMQEGSRGTGPTWEEWRWGPGETSKGTPINTVVNVANFGKCARLFSPSPDQFSASLDLDQTYQLMLLADHIYCLCVQCDLPKFPSSWAGKVSMLDVIEADACLENEYLDHYFKATATHKLLLWAARDQGLHTAMVLEEDFGLPDIPTTSAYYPVPTVDYSSLREFIRSGSWEFVRFGHQPYHYEAGDCLEECKCAAEELSNNVCTPAGRCDIRSTVAYMVTIRDSIVDGALKAPGWIDKFIMQDFKNAYIVPGIIYQKNKVEEELRGDSDFRYRCLI